MSKIPSIITKAYGLGDVLKFGKHKGHNIQHVMQEDPQWLYWAIDNVEGFQLSNEAFNSMPPQEDLEDPRDFIDWGEINS